MNYYYLKMSTHTVLLSHTEPAKESSLMLDYWYGKTSLSANAHQLIGDDEHMWTLQAF